MRKSLILLPLLLIAAPAAAQPEPKLPPELTDPKTAERLADTMQSLSQAFLDLPAGEIQASIEGREPTPAEKKMTVGDVARRNDPNFERSFRKQMAEVGPTIERGMKALRTALPAMVKALDDVGRAIDRAAANMPDPTYPKR